jgi:hypothetical protein
MNGAAKILFVECPKISRQQFDPLQRARVFAVRSQTAARSSILSVTI